MSRIVYKGLIVFSILLSIINILIDQYSNAIISLISTCLLLLLSKDE